MTLCSKNMKVILLQDVAGVGKKWDVKEVKSGYARNYLLPQNLAVLAAPPAVKEAQFKQKQETQKRALQEALLEKTLDALRDFTFVIERRANEKGHLFDGLDIKEIAGLIKEKFKIEIPGERIKLEKSIKEIGKYKIAFQKGETEVPFEIEIKPSP